MILKRIHEAQDLKDELGQEPETNQALLAPINELISQLDIERHQKSGESHCQFFNLHPCSSRL
jgi:hypothetical protein